MHGMVGVNILTALGIVFALGFGYIVCFLAAKTVGSMKVLGYTIGIGIMSLMAILIIGNLYIIGAYGPRTGGMGSPMMKKGMMHHGMMNKGMMRQGMQNPDAK
jgi:hypothetical protein